MATPNSEQQERAPASAPWHLPPAGQNREEYHRHWALSFLHERSFMFHRHLH